jgi:hypothetical protein
MLRAATTTLQCKLCRRIFVNNLWLRERREYHVKYRGGLCSHCVSLRGPRTLHLPPGDPGRALHP